MAEGWQNISGEPHDWRATLTPERPSLHNYGRLFGSSINGEEYIMRHPSGWQQPFFEGYMLNNLRFTLPKVGALLVVPTDGGTAHA